MRYKIKRYQISMDMKNRNSGHVLLDLDADNRVDLRIDFTSVSEIAAVAAILRSPEAFVENDVLIGRG